MQDQESVALRSTPGRAEAEEWALVLVAEGLTPRLERASGAFVLCVPWPESARAESALSEYDLEHLPRRHEAGLIDEAGSSWSLPAALGVTASLLCFFVVTGPREQASHWFAQGSANAQSILSGELWRSVTALTLHADIPHIVGNALFGTLFMAAVFRILGPGLGGLLVLASGIAGNLANALWHTSGHSSVGASTAIFGAVGLLGGLGVAQRVSRGGRGLRAWAPAAAGLGLLAMIGTGARSDLSAHLLGLAAGWLLGMLTARLLPTRPGLAGQWLLGGAAIALLLGSWQVSFGQGG